MSTANITYFADMASLPGGMLVPLAKSPAMSVEEVTFTTTQAQSAAFPDYAQFVRVITDANARVLIGANPTVTNSSGTRIISGMAEWFAIPPKSGMKMAFINSGN